MTQASQNLTQKPSKYQFVTGKMERGFIRTSNYVRRVLLSAGEYQNIRRKKKLIEKVILTEDQKRQIDEFFLKHYGKKISHSWHRLYQSYTGVFRYDYFPEVLLSTRLEPMLCPYREAELFGDKNLLESLFGTVEGVHIPKTYLSSVKGRMRTGTMEMVNSEQAALILANQGKCVIKKTTETNSGRDVIMCQLEDGVDKKTGLTIKVLLSQFGQDFVVQEQVEQNDVLAKLNASSLNTFRVITYVLDNQIWHCPAALRLGRSGAEKDNIHYGGIGVGIRENGTLRKQAFAEMGDSYISHPDSGIFFDGYQILGFDKVIAAAHRLHARIPYLGMISWDLSLDKDGIPVLIEMNTTRQAAWFCQMVNGEALFGQNTGRILKAVRK